MIDKRSWEERSHEFEISIINEPVVDFEVEPVVFEPERSKPRLVVNNDRKEEFPRYHQ